MADNLEPFHDKAADTKSCSTVLIDQVNQERSKSSVPDSVSKLNPQHAEKVKELFGSLQIFSSDSQTLPVSTELSTKPEAPTSIPATADSTKITADSAKAASNIEDAFHWYKKDDYDMVDAALKGKTPEQIKSLDDAFKNEHHGKSIEETLSQRWKNQPEELAKARALLHPTDSSPAVSPDRPEQTAESIKAKDAKAVESLRNDPEVKAQHDELVKHARETMKEPELGKFLDNMSKFEIREASMQRQYEKENVAKGMPAEESAKQAEIKVHEQVKDSYKHIETLIEGNDKSPVSQKDRTLLAQQVMNHAAEPASISQGSYGTCSVAVVENRTFSRDPAEATRLVSEVATSGKYTREGKPPIKLDNESLKKQGDATKETSEKGSRDFASQIFEVTAANVALDHRNSLTNPPGQLRYEQHKPVKGHSAPPDDKGERLMDYSTHPPKVIEHGLGLTSADIAYASKEISPKGSEGGVVIDYSCQIANLQKKVIDADLKANGIGSGNPIDLKDPDWATKAHGAVSQKEGLDVKERKRIDDEITILEKQQKENRDGPIVQVQNEQELRDTLTKLKEQGRLPVIVSVNTNNEPFWSDSKGGDAGGSGDGHVVTISDYDEKTGVAKMVNQWDAHADHDITARQLFEATRNPKDAIDDLKKEVKTASAEGHRDYVKEYELLRLEKQQNTISDAEYDKLAVEQTLARWKDFKSGKIAPDDPDYLAATREFSLMRESLKNSGNPADQKRCEAIEAGISAGVKA